jgi:hypothetical protein
VSVSVENSSMINCAWQFFPAINCNQRVNRELAMQHLTGAGVLTAGQDTVWLRKLQLGYLSKVSTLTFIHRLGINK